MPLFPWSVDSTRTYSTGVKTFAIPVPTNEKHEQENNGMGIVKMQ